MLYTDIYNSERFSKKYGHKIRWSKDYGGWFIYNGKHWKRDNNDIIKKYAIEFYKVLCEELQENKFNLDDYQLNQFSKHVKNTGQNGKLEAMLDCSKAFLGEGQEKFDSNYDLFNSQNGTINLKTKMFQEFNPNDLLTKISNVNFDSKSECPRWTIFLEEIFLGNKEIIEFIQRVVGYSMTASTKEQCLFIFYGFGRNGKSIFIDTISYMLGDYAVNCPSTTLIRKPNSSAVPNDLASLKGARFVTAVESNQNVTLDEALIKQLTGGDKITARFLHKEYFEFKPTFKIFIATNHKPNIRGTDVGIWRRIRMIPFDLRITDENDDRNLGDKLREELPGIFKWAIEGYKKWESEGLKTPQVVLDATGNYQDEEDDLGQFIKDYCIEDEGGYIPINEFKNKFKEIVGYYKGQKIISEYMHRMGIIDDRVYTKGTQVRCWKGMRFVKFYEHQSTLY